MNPHGVNPTLSIFLPTPFPVAMQGLGATAPWEKDLHIPCLEIIVFINCKTGILLAKEINAHGKSQDEIKQLFLVTELVFSKHAAISQFKGGLQSGSSNLIYSSNYEVMKSYFKENDQLLTFDSLIEIIDYPQLKSSGECSNELFKQRMQ